MMDRKVVRFYVALAMALLLVWYVVTFGLHNDSVFSVEGAIQIVGMIVTFFWALTLGRLWLSMIQDESSYPSVRGRSIPLHALLIVFFLAMSALYLLGSNFWPTMPGVESSIFEQIASAVIVYGWMLAAVADWLILRKEETLLGRAKLGKAK